MTIRLSMSLQDLAVLRFAVSPVWELVASVRVLRDPTSHPVHMPWFERVRDRIRGQHPDLELLWGLVPVPTRTLPAFLAPTPDESTSDPHTSIDGLLGQPGDVVAESIASVFGASPPPAVRQLKDDPARHLPALVAQMHDYWDLALAPDWPSIQALLEADRRDRGLRLVEEGPARLFEQLNPAIRWEDGTVIIAQDVTSADHDLAGRGLVLVPSAFTWPRVFVKATPQWPPVLRYPAAGAAGLWLDRQAPSQGLAGVLGSARSQLLEELEVPASTTELAQRCGMSPAGVSAHLHKLKAAGLLWSQRVGRSVLYGRTDIGDTLITRGRT